MGGRHPAWFAILHTSTRKSAISACANLLCLHNDFYTSSNTNYRFDTLTTVYSWLYSFIRYLPWSILSHIFNYIWYFKSTLEQFNANLRDHKFTKQHWSLFAMQLNSVWKVSLLNEVIWDNMFTFNEKGLIHRCTFISGNAEYSSVTHQTQWPCCCL